MFFFHNKFVVSIQIQRLSHSIKKEQKSPNYSVTTMQHDDYTGKSCTSIAPDRLLCAGQIFTNIYSFSFFSLKTEKDFTIPIHAKPWYTLQSFVEIIPYLYRPVYTNIYKSCFFTVKLGVIFHPNSVFLQPRRVAGFI